MPNRILSLNVHALNAALASGVKVQCHPAPMLGKGFWCPIRAARVETTAKGRTLWVQEADGLQGWFIPDKARRAK